VSPDGRARSGVRFGQRSAASAAPLPFGRAGLVAGALVVLVVVAGMTWSAVAETPAAATRPQLFGGSLVLADQRPLTVIDLATGAITIRLTGVFQQVGAASDGQVLPVAVEGGTMLVNRTSGNFNFLGADDYVTDPAPPGVSLGPLSGTSGATGLADGPDAYILRSAPHSSVSLVGPQTVEQAVREVSPGAGSGSSSLTGRTPAVLPLGSATLPGVVDLAPGGAVVAGGSLWVLQAQGSGCRVDELTPVPTSRQGLVVTGGPSFAGPCRDGALEAAGDRVAWALPGRVELVGASPRRAPGASRSAGGSSRSAGTASGPAGGSSRSAATASGSAGGAQPRPPSVATPFSASAGSVLPVEGATGEFWFLAGGRRGWELFGLPPAGPVTGPFPLDQLGPGSDPAVPALAGGYLYTLDQNQSPQPPLWTIALGSGRMAPLPGVARYPIVSSTEKDDFHGVQILEVGPRVVINNPGSLDAVVVFTDGSRPPLVVDKSLAATVSATGPADLTLPDQSHSTATTTPATRRATAGPPVVQPVSQQITCANTTQKPYAPQITGLTPSSGTVLVQWSYQLLDQTDCEPDSWTVQVTALDGSPQPAQPTQPVTGQDQYLFSGLRPATHYEVTVTAFINTQSTASTPAFFTTQARGPDAPLSVTTSADGTGDWVVSWTPCTEAANPNCVVPAAQWTVTGSACGGDFVGTPPSVQVPGTQTSVTINATSLGLLGDSLSFSVQGSLPSGLTGNPTSDGSCTQAWEGFSASEVALSGSGQAQPDGTISAILVASTTGDLATLLQSHPTEADFVFSVGGRTVGPTHSPTVTVPGLPAGESLTPSVTVYPDGHPQASVTVAGAPFTQDLSWPADLSPTVTAAVDPADPNQGSFTVTLPPDAPTPVTATGPDAGTASSSGPLLQCGGSGGATYPYPVTTVGSGRSFTLPIADLVTTGGDCTISFTLTDTAQPDPYGVPSPAVVADFQIGQLPAYRFQDAFAPDCSNGPGGNKCGLLGQPWQLVVSTAPGSPPLSAGGNWTITTKAEGQDGQEVVPDLCYTSQAVEASDFPDTVTLPASCLDPQQVDVTVSFEYLGQTVPVDAGFPDNAPGTPPTTTTTTTTTSTTVPTTTRPTTTTTTPTTAGATPSTQAGAARSREAAQLAAAVVPPPGVTGAAGWTAAVTAGVGTLSAAARARRRVGRRRTNHRPGPQEDAPT
jgi:hypothetical protein